MVRVLAIADEVAPALDGAAVRRIAPDLVLAAGDLPWDYLEFFVCATDAPVVFVPGNHDPDFEVPPFLRTGPYVDCGDLSEQARPRGAVNADRTVVRAAGLSIAGLGGSLRYNNGPHQYTQRQYDRRARRLLRNARRAAPVDVLLTHAPPRHLGDQEDPCHQGIDALHRVLEQVRPTWHLHGHIHPYGEQRPDRTVGPTTLRNVIPYKVIEIEPRTGTVAQNPRTGARMVR
jgi:Icc-related predicted phosphoesterase